VNHLNCEELGPLRTASGVAWSLPQAPGAFLLSGVLVEGVSVERCGRRMSALLTDECRTGIDLMSVRRGDGRVMVNASDISIFDVGAARGRQGDGKC
jgi:hypothetical protein